MKNTTKETLLGLAITAIASGVSLIQADMVTGLVLVAVGAGLVALRGFLKVN